MKATIVRFGEDLRPGFVGRLEWGKAAIFSYFSSVSEEARLRTGLRSMFIEEIEADLFDVVDSTLIYDAPEGAIKNGVQVIGWQDAVVQAAQFVCSPEGRRRGSGAMRRLKDAVATSELNEELKKLSDEELLVWLREEQERVNLLFAHDRFGPGRDPRLEAGAEEFYRRQGRYANIAGTDPLDDRLS